MQQLKRSWKVVLTAAIVGSLAAVGITAGYADIQAKPISRFNHNTEKWTVTGDPVSQTPQYFKKGGNPTGFIRTTDAATGGIMYWKAPAKFLGNQGAAYGGTLRFDLRETAAGNPFDAADVILKGGGLRLTYDAAKDPEGHWTRFKVPLSETGWLNRGQPATQANMLAVLAALGTMLIRAEYTSHDDSNDLDNVTIKLPSAAR
jgi:laminin B (domain IV)